MTDQPGAPVPPGDAPTDIERDATAIPATPTQPSAPATQPSAPAGPAIIGPSTGAGADPSGILEASSTQHEASAWAPAAPDPTAPPPVAVAPVVPAATTEGPALAPPGAEPTQPSGRGGVRVLGYLAAAVAGAALTVGLLAATGSLTATAPKPSPSPSPDPSPAYESARSIGDPAAPVTIEIWADFQCPYCGLQARGVEPTIERTYAATSRALVTYRDFAFLGAESFDAAVAARCAGQQGAFWYMHDLLFASQQGENQGAFAADRLQGLASFAGLDAAAYTACVADPTVRQAVEDETATGRSLGVESTPTIRIVGPGGVQVVKGLKPFSEIEAAFEQAATPAPSGSPGSSPSATGTAPSPSATGAGSSPSPASPSGASPSP